MEFVEIDYHEYSFKPPTSIAVCGPTGSGKTEWVSKMIRNMDYVFEQNGMQPRLVLFCYSIYQELYKKLKEGREDIVFHHGVPSIQFVYELAKKQPLLVVLDDLVHKIVDNVDMLMLFVQGSHHMNITVVFMSQNLYQGGKHARTIALNVKYIVLFANPRDVQQIKYLGRQIFPFAGHFLAEAYKDAVESVKFGYLLIDLHGDTAAEFRLRSQIFPGDDVIVVYQPT